MSDLISIVVPVYGDKSLVKKLYDRLVEETDKIDADFEFILVNDCCPYGSGFEIEKLALQDKRVKFVDLMRNVGQHLAIKAGIDCAKGDYAIVMDCDLQDNPKEIANFYNKIKNANVDVVFGMRKSRKEGFVKQLYSKVANLIISKFSDISSNEKDKNCGNYSIFNKRVLDELKTKNEPYFVFTTIIRSTGFEKDYIMIEQEERYTGVSGYNFFKGLKLFLQIIINNSNKPLIFAAYCAFVMFLICLLFMVKLFVDYFLLGGRLLGWTSLMCAIFLIGGLIFVYLGLLGIYIGQIFKLVQNRPVYTIKRSINL